MCRFAEMKSGVTSPGLVNVSCLLWGNASSGSPPILLCLYWRGRNTHTEMDGQTEHAHPLLHSTNAHNSWARPKLGARNSIQVTLWVAETQVLKPSLTCCLAGNVLVRSSNPGASIWGVNAPVGFLPTVPHAHPSAPL